MPKRLDLKGKTFGRLTVVDFYDVQHGMSRWKCKCSCGNKIIAYGRHMVAKNTQSCGCLGKERRQQACTKHGMSYDPIYTTWADVRDRCSNPHSVAYQYYGGRGISVCDEWQTFQNFAKWAYQNGYRPGLTIDRIESDKDYCPENCQWITQRDNVIRMLESHSKLHWARNLETGEYYEFTIVKWFAEEHGLNPRILCAIFRGEHRPLEGWEFGILSEQKIS